jgi:hypothetical protein
LDHGLSEAHVKFLLETFSDRKEFFIETLTLPEELSPVSCALYGPLAGDSPVLDVECEIVARGERKWPSRLCNRPARMTRRVTVVAGPDGDEPCVLYTAYGGPEAPREPGDTSLDDAGRAASADFWKDHALAR